MKRIIFFLLVIIFSTCISANLYVKTFFARLRTKPGVIKNNDLRLKRGMKLRKLKYKKNWYFVSVKFPNGKEYKGWIYKGKVSKRRPENEKLHDDGSTVDPNVVILYVINAKRKEGDSIKEEHRNALKYQTSFDITEKEMENFLQEAGIGPYRK